MQEVQDIANAHNGIVTVAQAEAEGIARSRLSEMVRAGELERVGRGVYCLPGVWEDEFLIAQLRFPKGVFSDGTALFLHDFTDRTPERITMTFPRSYNATGARRDGIEVRTCADDVLDLGIETMKTPLGNEVRAYDLERTLCDLLRGQSAPDAQVVNPAMKAYVRSSRKNPQKLLGYSKALGVEAKIRNYLAVLL